MFYDQHWNMGIKQYEAVCILVSPVRNILELPNGKYTMNEDWKLVVQKSAVLELSVRGYNYTNLNVSICAFTS